MGKQWLSDQLFRSSLRPAEFKNRSFEYFGSCQFTPDLCNRFYCRYEIFCKEQPDNVRLHLSVLAEEVLLRSNTYLVSGNLYSILETHRPFGEEYPAFSALKDLASSAAVFPLKGKPSSGHIWIFRDPDNLLGRDHRHLLEGYGNPDATYEDLKVFILHSLQEPFIGKSWQFAFHLAARALEDTELGKSLAADWLLTGSVDSGVIHKVDMGNKTSLLTGRNWLIPSDNYGDWPQNWNPSGQVRTALDVDQAVDIIMGSGTLREGAIHWPESVSTIYSFSSEAETTMAAAAILSGAEKIVLFTSNDESKSVIPAVNVKRYLESNTSVAVEIPEERVSAIDVYEVEKYLKEKIGLLKGGTRGTTIIHVTTGNKLMHLAASNIARMFPDIMLVYSEIGSNGFYTAIYYEGLQPATRTLDEGFYTALKNIPDEDRPSHVKALLGYKRVEDFQRLSAEPVLIGNSFSMGLIKSKVVICQESIDSLKLEIDRRGLCSFWGHSNTISLASEMVGHDLTPDDARPSLTLNEDKRPFLRGRSFSECWVIAPEYKNGIRPEIGREVNPDQISGWIVNRIKW